MTRVKQPGVRLHLTSIILPDIDLFQITQIIHHISNTLSITGYTFYSHKNNVKNDNGTMIASMTVIIIGDFNVSQRYKIPTSLVHSLEYRFELLLSYVIGVTTYNIGR